MKSHFIAHIQGERLTPIAVDKIRLYLVDSEERQRSAAWYFYHIGQHVYIGPSLTGGKTKLSFHPEGASHDGSNAQWGLVGNYARAESELGREVLRPARWRRPATPTSGFIKAASIVFPTDFQSGKFEEFPPGKKRISVPLAASGHAIDVGVFFCPDALATIAMLAHRYGWTPLAYMSLPGEAVVVGAHEIPFDNSAIPPANMWASRMHPLSGAPGPGESIDNAGAMLMREKPKDGDCVMLASINGIRVVNKN